MAIAKGEAAPARVTVTKINRVKLDARLAEILKSYYNCYPTFIADEEINKYIDDILAAVEEYLND